MRAYIHTCIHAHLKTDRQTGAQTGAQTDRHACIHAYALGEATAFAHAANHNNINLAELSEFGCDGVPSLFMSRTRCQRRSASEREENQEQGKPTDEVGPASPMLLGG
eukprot:5443650-Pyramimonas_sp.AAC.1